MYAKDKRTVRYDNPNKTRFKKKKAIIPEHLPKGDTTLPSSSVLSESSTSHGINNWTVGKNNELWPCYGLEEVLYSASVYKSSTNKPLAILAVEGEKTCNYVRRLGLCCITFQTSQYSFTAIEEQLLPLSLCIGLIVFIEDNDEPGKKKGKDFVQGANLAGIPNLSIGYSDLVRGYIDVVQPEDDLVNSNITDRQVLINLITTYINNLSTP
jgi:hypothetical protein